MNKVMLIAGCSHTSGSEIDGTPDSKYNRDNSYGSILAKRMGYTPINVADPGSTNGTIARTVLDWVNNKYDPNSMQLFVTIGWTESVRMEVPCEREHWYEQYAASTEYYSPSSRYYWRMNPGWHGGDPEEKELVPQFHRFMAEHEPYLELVSLNLILQIQYLLKSLNVDYVMCNTMHLANMNQHTQIYFDSIDQTKYFNLLDGDKSFYWMYRNQGYSNPKALYWHHDEIPHKLYADELYNFIESNKQCSS